MKRIAAALALTVLVLTGCTAPPATLANGAPVVESIDGEWAAIPGPEVVKFMPGLNPVTLRLNDGTWMIDGCDAGGGGFDYTEAGHIVITSGRQVPFNEGSATLPACVDAAGGWHFDRAFAATIIDGELVIFDAQENEIGRLERA